MGDYNDDKIIDGFDMTGILNHFAENTEESVDFQSYFDLNFDGNVTLLDVSFLLRYLGGLITDFID